MFGTRRGPVGALLALLAALFVALAVVVTMEQLALAGIELEELEGEEVEDFDTEDYQANNTPSIEKAFEPELGTTAEAAEINAITATTAEGPEAAVPEVAEREEYEPERENVDPTSSLQFPTLKICGQYLCLRTEPSGFTGMLRPRVGRRPPYEMMYFPTIPRSGNTYTRKLWEATTGVASESVWREASTVDRRTGAYYRPCGLPMETRGGMGSVDSTAMCKYVAAPQKHSPALVKSHDKIHPRRNMIRQMTSLLIIVRNPLDNFVSDLVDRNRKAIARTVGAKYVAPDLKQVKLPIDIPVKRWVNSYWASYLRLWLFNPNNRAKCQTGKGRSQAVRTCVVPRVPTYVIRFEDLHRDPASIMTHMLAQTGIGLALNVSEDKIRSMVAFVNNGTKAFDPGKAANCRRAFDYVASTLAEAKATLKILGQHQKLLTRLGYFFELNDSLGVSSASHLE